MNPVHKRGLYSIAGAASGTSWQKPILHLGDCLTILVSFKAHAPNKHCVSASRSHGDRCWKMFQDVFFRPSHLILPVDTKVEKHETEMEMMEELSSAFQDFHLTEEDDVEDVEDVDSVDYRVLFQGRDLELEPLWRSRGRVGSSRLESGRVGSTEHQDPR